MNNVIKELVNTTTFSIMTWVAAHAEKLPEQIIKKQKKQTDCETYKDERGYNIISGRLNRSQNTVAVVVRS